MTCSIMGDYYNNLRNEITKKNRQNDEKEVLNNGCSFLKENREKIRQNDVLDYG